jgi:hypothetical protein
VAGSVHLYAHMVILILESNPILGLVFYSRGHLNVLSLGGTIGKAKIGETYITSGNQFLVISKSQILQKVREHWQFDCKGLGWSNYNDMNGMFHTSVQEIGL